jgi:hypothetical protein
MPELNIRVDGIPEVIEKLQGLPDATRWCLQQSILHCLRHGKAESSRIVRSRYLIGARNVLAAIGTPRLSGVSSGFIRATGSKFPLSMFPHQLFEGRGIQIQEMAEGPPVTLRHAFNERIFERKTPQTARYPIMRMVSAASVPQALAEKHVFPKLQDVLQRDVNSELQRLVRGVLSGAIKPGRR